MTFDPACSHYTGPWLTVSSSGRNYTTPIVNGSHLAGDNFFLKQAKGAEVVVMNGTGAYQSRRLLDWGHTAAGGLWWLLDRPFAAAPGAESFLEITCTHTHIIFERDRHEDVGVVAGDVFPMRQIQACLTEARLEFQKGIGGSDLLDGQHIRPDGGEGFSDLAACGFGLGNPGAGSFHEVIFQVVGDNLETRGFRDEEKSPEKWGKQQS